MKICLIGDANSIHIRRWAGWFKDRGHEIQMISLTPMNTPIDIYDKYVYVAKKQGLVGYSRTIFPIRRVVADWKPDIVHGHYLTSGGFYASMSGCRNKVVSAWGSDVYNDAKSRLKGIAIRYAIEHSKVCISCSDHIMDTIRNMCPTVDVRKILFGADTEHFKPNPVKHDKFRFLSIRQTTKLYNQEIIIKAFEQADLDAELWIFKPSADSFDVYDYVKSRPELDKKVVWLDTRPYDQMPELFNSVDVGISIPPRDNASAAVIECMACGVPVIASAIPSNVEWITSGLNGFLTPNITLSKVIEMFYRLNKETILSMGNSARKKIVKNADWNTEMLKAEKIYQEIVERVG